MQPEFCAYHLMHAGVASSKRRAVCGVGAAAAATLQNHGFDGDAYPKLWLRVASVVGGLYDTGRDVLEGLWDSLEGVWGLLEAGVETVFGSAGAEWLEGWFSPPATSWKGMLTS